MASKVSSPPKKIATDSPTRPVPRPTPSRSAAAAKSVPSGPVDSVSVRGEQPPDPDRMRRLEGGLLNNFAPDKTAPVRPVARDSSGQSDPGQRSVDLARRFEGMESQDVKGLLDNFQAAGGRTNNCADFVSSVLESSGRGIEQTASVGELRQQLLDKGWQAIPSDQARPGDVWMTVSNQVGSRHTELITTPGATHAIGSNNVAEGQQEIFEREARPGIIYGYRPPEN